MNLMAYLNMLLEGFGPFRYSFPLASIVVAIAIAILKLYLKKNPWKKKHNYPPSPPKLPIIGNLHQLGSTPHISLFRLAEKFGPLIYLKLGEIPTVVASSAGMAKEILTSHEMATVNRPKIFSAKYLFYNYSDIGFAPYSAYWRHIRKISVCELLSSKRVQSYSYVREQEVAHLIHRIAESCSETADLSKMLEIYANSVLCRATLGRAFSSGGEYDTYGFQDMLEEYQVLLGGFSFGDFFPSMKLIHSLTGLKSRLQNTFLRFDRFFDEMINEHLKTEKAEKEEKDLLHVLLDIQRNESTDMPLTMDNVKAIIMDMFVAGTDTTFITLDWGMTELIMNPKVMRKAQAEVRSILGERRVVLESDLPKLHYMKAVIKEIFRLHPPAPLLLPRESSEDIIIDGYNIPARTRFFINVWAIGRDSKLWDNPEAFEPERFINSSIEFKGRDFELIPFGSGKRICPGIAFGIATVELGLAQLLHSFDWELPPGTEAKDLDMSEVFGITMHRIAHLLVVAKPYFPQG